jgi:hypothetical protein
MKIEIKYEVLPDVEWSDIPRIYRCIYDGTNLMSKELANPIEVFTSSPDTLDTFVEQCKQTLLDYCETLTSFEAISNSLENSESHLKINALAGYIRELSLTKLAYDLPQGD